MPLDRLAALYPERIDELPVSWQQLRIPAPPPACQLTPQELGPGPAEQRFKRRTILDCALNNGDRIAFIDNARPHSQFDLMCDEVSQCNQPTLGEIDASTAHAIWYAAHHFVEFADLKKLHTILRVLLLLPVIIMALIPAFQGLRGQGWVQKRFLLLPVPLTPVSICITCDLIGLPLAFTSAARSSAGNISDLNILAGPMRVLFRG